MVIVTPKGRVTPMNDRCEGHCEDCKHFAQYHAEETQGQRREWLLPGGECRADPPAIGSDRWPKVWDDDFCGRFEPWEDSESHDGGGERLTESRHV